MFCVYNNLILSIKALNDIMFELYTAEYNGETAYFPVEVGCGDRAPNDFTVAVAPLANNKDQLLEELRTKGVASIPVRLLGPGINEKEHVFLRRNKLTLRNELQKVVKTMGEIPSPETHSSFFYEEHKTRYETLKRVETELMSRRTPSQAASWFHRDYSQPPQRFDGLGRDPSELHTPYIPYADPNTMWVINLWSAKGLGSKELRTLVQISSSDHSFAPSMSDPANQYSHPYSFSHAQKMDDFLKKNQTEKELFNLESTLEKPQEKKLGVIGKNGTLYVSPPDNEKEILVFLGNIVEHSALMPMSKKLSADHLRIAFNYLLSLGKEDLSDTQYQRLITLVAHHVGRDTSYFDVEEPQIKALRFLGKNNKRELNIDQQQQIINKLLWKMLIKHYHTTIPCYYRSHARRDSSLSKHIMSKGDVYDASCSDDILKGILARPDDPFCKSLEKQLREEQVPTHRNFYFGFCCSSTKASNPIFDALQTICLSALPPSITMKSAVF